MLINELFRPRRGYAAASVVTGVPQYPQEFGVIELSPLYVVLVLFSFWD
jgi:hypothetical protein